AQADGWTNALRGGVGRQSRAAMAQNHVDVDALLEDYAWKHFRDIQSLRKTRLDDFKNLEREDVEFVLNRKKLVVTHDEPKYSQLNPMGARPYTLFKSIYTNNTDRPQEYSFKTERTTESICSITREQGYMIGTEAELTLKTPCEIAEMKAGFKHEMQFNNINENTKSEILSWGVDSNVVVPAHYITEASIIIEEMNYQGTYTVTSTLSGFVTISIRRRRDGALVLPLTMNIVEVFREHLESRTARKEVKAAAMVQGNQCVRIISKGRCQFQFALKQRIDLKEEPFGDKEKMMVD
uniref:Vitellogenin n=1 Tax=Parascaris univalens TaxID=6257 RepID=A0A915AG52_PARUN